MTAPLISRLPRPMWYVLSLIVVVALLIIILVFLSWRRPESSLRDGRLAPCPDSPNCVCSQDADTDHAIAPLAFDGEASSAMDRLRILMSAWSRARVVAAKGDYLRVEISTPLLAFVDDVEFLVDHESGVIHVRSASRVGHSDLGANRARVEAIRQAWDSAGPSHGQSSEN